MLQEIHSPLHVITNRKILNTTDIYAALCRNKTILILANPEKKRTGLVTDISIDHKQPNTISITYEKKVQKITDGPKQIKFKFDNSQDMDIFLAAYTQAYARTDIFSHITKHGDRAQIKVWVGTFNMGNRAPKEEFTQFLRDASKQDPDIMFYAAQEADYGRESVDQLFSVILSALPNYKCIVKSAFWEMRMVILVKVTLEPLITTVLATTEATGILNIMGNKGGLISGFSVLGSPIAFVASHLNAHQGNMQRRNQDFVNICTVDNAAKKPFDLCSGFHHVIWAGDLNYRIEMTYDEVIAATERRDWDAMWAHDQLHQQMALGNTFNGFTEGKIEFAPTYKFKKGTCQYDQESTRIPAWCDRVLIRSFEGLEKQCVAYSHHSTVTTSDHHPVSALWKLDVVMPPPPPPPFASVIGVKPYIEISSLKIDIGAPIESVQAEFVWKYKGPDDKLCTGIGKGKKYVVFPDDTVPLLVPNTFVIAEHLKTEYVHIVFTVNNNTAIAILPLSVAFVDVSRQFAIKAEYKLKEIGKVTGTIKLVFASEAHILEQRNKRNKVHSSNEFQSLS